MWFAIIVLAIFFLIIGFFVYMIKSSISKSSKKRKAKKQLDMPKSTLPLSHMGGDSFQNWGDTIYYRRENNYLNFWDLKSQDRLTFTADKITSFYLIGDISHNMAIKGGGASIGGAVVGGALFGVPGALIGGRKKVKSRTQTINAQTLIIKFSDSGQEKGLKIFQPACIYEDLCYLCPDKKIAI
jgi:hypothetical protein